MRKLVTLRKVSEILPIEKADRIESAVIDGWTCVVVKNQFKAGDTGVFHEIDSFIPTEQPRYAFLEKESREWNGKHGTRIKTKRLRKALSQGLLMPLSDFPEITELDFEADYSEKLGVLKWEPSNGSNTSVLKSPKGTRLKPFPSFIPKTDEERVQNIPHLFENHPDKHWEVTEKLDGSSATFFWDGKEFGVCSRNVWLKPQEHSVFAKVKFFLRDYWRMVTRCGDFNFMTILRQHSQKEEKSVFWQMADRLNLVDILPRLASAYAIQGEIIGEGIQGNYYKITGHEFYVFNIYDITEGRYLLPVERYSVLNTISANFGLNLKIVPVIAYSTSLKRFGENIHELLKYAAWPSLINPDVIREGLVYKWVDGNFSFKTVSNEFLLATDS